MIEFRILFFGDITNISSNSRKIADLIKEFCPNSRFIDWADFTKPNQRRFFRRLDGHAFTQNNLHNIGNLLINEINDFKPNVIWLEKPLLVTAELIQKIKNLHPNAFLFQDKMTIHSEKEKMSPLFGSTLLKQFLYTICILSKESQTGFALAGWGLQKLLTFGLDMIRNSTLSTRRKKLTKSMTFPLLAPIWIHAHPF